MGEREPLHGHRGKRSLSPIEGTRSAPGAASVTQRWWEAPSAPAPTETVDSAIEGSQAAAGAEAVAGAGAVAGAEDVSRPLGSSPPPPPPPPQRLWDEASQQRARVQQLEQELAVARDEASALHEMLEDLPEIFERKFRQRLQGVMEQQQRLLADNQALRDRLYALQPAGSEAAGLGMRLLPPASGPDPDDSEARPPLRRWIKGVMQRGREWMPGRASASSDDDDDLSDRDGGRPTAA